MKKYIINLMLSSAVALTALTACTQEESNLLPNDETTSEQTEKTEREHEEGYFTATFFPQTVDGTDTRAAIDGYSNRIQSLVCLIYQRQENENGGYEYKFYTEEQIINYQEPKIGQDGNKIWTSYRWPYQEVNFKLPNGDYKAVFVANTDMKLFEGIDPLKHLLTGYNGTYEAARINMPETVNDQPINFEDHNMFYLCTVEFNEYDFDGTSEPPHVLLQRLVSGNVYGHDLINLNSLTNDLLNEIVSRISSGTFLSDTIEGVLESTITQTVTGIIDGIFTTGDDGLLGKILDIVNRYGNLLNINVDINSVLTQVLNGILNELLAEQVLDPLVQQITGRLLTDINNILFQPIFESLNTTLLGGDPSILGLNGVINPWAHVEHVDIMYSSLPKSINFDRNVVASYQWRTTFDDYAGLQIEYAPTFENVQVTTNDLGLKDAIVYTLCGENTLQTIDPVPDDVEGLLDLFPILGNTLDGVDKHLLNGLLISMHIPLNYQTGSNLMYTTRCEVLSLGLTNFDEDPNKWDGEEVQINLHVGDILMNSPIQSILEGLLGKGAPLRVLLDTVDGLLKAIDGLLSIPVVGPIVKGILGIDGVGNLVDNLLVALLGDSNGNAGLVGELIKELSNGIGLKLPSLGINNIQLGGQWGATKVSDGSIISEGTNVPKQ